MITKKIVLAGAKGAGKTALLKELENYNLSQQAKGEDHPYLIPNQLDSGKIGNWALDRLADYRTELYLALDRIEDEQEGGYMILESSLIDNMSYVATRLSYIINDGTGSEDDLVRWEIVLHAVGRMLRDSELPDAVIYVPGHAEEDFYEKLEEAIVATIWEMLPDSVEKFKLNAIDPLQRAEEIATIVSELNEPRDIDQESSGEDQ